MPLTVVRLLLALTAGAVLLFGVASAQGVRDAIRAGDLEALRGAIASGAEVDARDEFGQTLMMSAIVVGRLDMVQVLLAAGANVQATTLAGWMPLHYAARSAEDERILGALLDAGAALDATSGDGATPLDVAIGHDNAVAVAFLSERLARLPRPPELRSWSAVLGTRWDGAEAFYSHPLCEATGCRYVGPAPVEIQGTLYWTDHVFRLGDPAGVQLHVVVRGPSHPLRDVIVSVGLSIENVDRYPIESLAAIANDMVRIESQGTQVIDAVDLCVTSADIREPGGTVTMRTFGTIDVNCALSRTDLFTGRRLPSPTFYIDVVMQH